MKLAEEAKKISAKLFSFWRNLEDKENGGFYGRVDHSLRLHQKADKGVTLTSRILYFFSEYYLLFKDREALSLAESAFSFLKKAQDEECGGIYWMLDYEGKVKDERKVAYNFAFALYACSYFYKASGKEEAKAFADSLFKDLITRFKQKDGNYLEEANRDFSPKNNDILSENGVSATFSMNLLLHLIEAYSAYYHFIPSTEGEKELRHVLNLFLDKVYNPNKGRLEVFFDENYKPLIDLESFGHEIEASWLLLEASETLNDEALASRIKEVSSELAISVKNRAYFRPFLANEKEDGKIDLTPIWWVEAEGVNGYLYQYIYFHNEEDLSTAKSLLNGIETYFIDPREGGEWFYELDDDYKPNENRDIVEPWKCPYHNGRMCFEIIKKGQEL